MLKLAGSTLDVSVIICAYTVDRWADLQRAVGSVLAQQPPVREVVVVVDHNVELLARSRACWPSLAATSGDAAGPAVRVASNSGARGLSGARNTGVALARSEIVAFLDDDAEASAGWIDRLLAAYSDPSVMACGGAALPVLSRPRPAWWPLEFDWIVGCSYPGLPTTTAPVRNLIGANMSVRRSAVMELGGFPEGIGRVGCRPVGCEETDLCIRLVDRWPQARILYEPAARVHHAVPPARLSWRYFRSRCYAEGLSKAKVAARVGAHRALASERSYAVAVLPRGIVTAVARACRGENGAGLRAMAMVAGMATAAAGYTAGRLATLLGGRVPCLPTASLAAQEG